VGIPWFPFRETEVNILLCLLFSLKKCKIIIFFKKNVSLKVKLLICPSQNILKTFNASEEL
jgi:hypothetical protein